MWRRDRLRAHRLRADLHGGLIGSEVVVLEEATSTNDMVWQMAGGDWPEGLIVFAEHQTAGRGQRGHDWESVPQKGLWFSALLNPQLQLKDSARLSEWAAGGIASTIVTILSLPARTRLPNDVYIGQKKVAGVLVEMRARPGASHVAIIGVGVNVNHSPADFSEPLRERATSLAIVRGVRVDRHDFAVNLLRNLDRSYRDAFR
jgi:BirA family biotin operon repressor/biotin-[acetyl-CoA-carboxylase] ligase